MEYMNLFKDVLNQVSHVPEYRRVQYRIVDNDTGEIYTSKSVTAEFFNRGSGEKALVGILRSYIRHIAAGKNVTFEVDSKPVNVVEQPLFVY